MLLYDYNALQNEQKWFDPLTQSHGPVGNSRWLGAEDGVDISWGTVKRGMLTPAFVYSEAGVFNCTIIKCITIDSFKPYLKILYTTKTGEKNA